MCGEYFAPRQRNGSHNMPGSRDPLVPGWARPGVTGVTSEHHLSLGGSRVEPVLKKLMPAETADCWNCFRCEDVGWGGVQGEDSLPALRLPVLRRRLPLAVHPGRPCYATLITPCAPSCQAYTGSMASCRRGYPGMTRGHSPPCSSRCPPCCGWSPTPASQPLLPWSSSACWAPPWALSVPCSPPSPPSWPCS